jgi:hypothetical protein
MVEEDHRADPDLLEVEARAEVEAEDSLEAVLRVDKDP